MIIVRLRGGLGNQLFQYAAARRLSHARGAELVLDQGWYDDTPPGATPREYELHHYPVIGRRPTPFESLICRFHSGRILRRLPIPSPFRTFRENGFAFDPKVLDLPDNIYLDGYWQSHLYFDDIAGLLSQELTPLQAPGTRDRLIADAIARGRAVSVHVRRGDYVTQSGATATHGLCSKTYYRDALALIAKHVSAPHLYVFSDDFPWARDAIHSSGPVTFVDHNGAANAFQDLRLMSLCQHHVIANSSFSWWGAWINRNPAKIVVAPAAWLADGATSDSQIPPSWIRL